MIRHQTRLVGGVALAVLIPALAGFAARGCSGWVFMWVMAFGLYFGFKFLSWIACDNTAPWPRQLAFLFGWPGMDAERFLGRPAIDRHPAHDCAVGLGFAVVGLAALTAGVFFIHRAPYLLGWGAMIGVVLTLHFGLFRCLRGLWRALGIDAAPVMNRPSAARTVGEFWGKRWNTAFRDVTHAFLFKPLTRTIGPRRAILLGFVFSGILHELVITVPARGGYGLPTAYFAWQGIAMLIERRNAFAGIRGRLAVVLPAPVLFPPVFVRNVVVPMLEALRQGVTL